MRNSPQQSGLRGQGPSAILVPVLVSAPALGLYDAKHFPDGHLAITPLLSTKRSESPAPPQLWSKNQEPLRIAQPAEHLDKRWTLPVHEDSHAINFCGGVDCAHGGEKQQDHRKNDLPPGRCLQRDAQGHQDWREERNL